MRRRLPRVLSAFAALPMLVPITAAAEPTPPTIEGRPRAAVPIEHVVIIMQENRSFDHYFGTYPGVDGIPRDTAGNFTVCNPDPVTKQCVSPYHEPDDPMHGGPHSMTAAHTAINGGTMDGFVDAQRRSMALKCTSETAGGCGTKGAAPDVMGYKDERDIPNYWEYARNFVLHDHMFSSVASWSLPAHLYMVSGWSARCQTDDPMSCRAEAQRPGAPPDWKRRLWNLNHPEQRKTAADFTAPTYAWTDITYLLDRAGVSWGYYVFHGREPDCRDDDALACQMKDQNAWTPGIWNPLPYFTTVRESGATRNVLPMRRFEQEVEEGRLRSVSWVIPNNKVSEHPLGTVADGQAWVTKLVNALMQGPDWERTAIFISWDEWGGFYDHVVPPAVDAAGYGPRVPSLLISPYARRGYVDHQRLSHDAYLKLIEDLFLGGRRLDPRTDGRPDPRPTVREADPQLGDLLQGFDFDQPPRRPLILDPRPPAGEANED